MKPALLGGCLLQLTNHNVQVFQTLATCICEWFKLAKMECYVCQLFSAAHGSPSQQVLSFSQSCKGLAGKENSFPNHPRGPLDFHTK